MDAQGPVRTAGLGALATPGSRRVSMPAPTGAKRLQRGQRRGSKPAYRGRPLTKAACPACCKSSASTLTRRTAIVTGGSQ